jgi:hypothetical protein
VALGGGLVARLRRDRRRLQLGVGERHLADRRIYPTRDSGLGAHLFVRLVYFGS